MCKHLAYMGADIERWRAGQKSARLAYASLVGDVVDYGLYCQPPGKFRGQVKRPVKRLKTLSRPHEYIRTSKKEVSHEENP